eukprot:119683-Hanusia_phi.AAC.1
MASGQARDAYGSALCPIRSDDLSGPPAPGPAPGRAAAAAARRENTIESHRRVTVVTGWKLQRLANNLTRCLNCFRQVVLADTVTAAPGLLDNCAL